MRLDRRARRRLALAALVCLGLGPWLAVFAIGAYLHSPLYRFYLERELTEFFALPTRVGKVRPLSWHERLAQDVEIFLPDGSGRLTADNRVGYCRTARWQRSRAPGRFDLVLADGTLDLTGARWARGDFRRLQRSVQHDYLRLNLDRVEVLRSSVRWGRRDFSIELGQTEGVIRFLGEGDGVEGVARLSALTLNGEPALVAVQARFDPLTEAAADGGELVREFVLATNPGHQRPIPLRQFRLDRLLGGPVSHGQFTGRLSYQAVLGDRRHVFTIHDSELTGLDVAEFTRWLPAGPVSGRLDLKVGQLQFEQLTEATGPPGRDGFFLTRLRFAGSVSELDLRPALAAFGLGPCDGKAFIRVHNADLAPGPVRTLYATGRVEGLDMAQLSDLAGTRTGGGRIRGPVRIPAFQIVVEDGQLKVLDAELFGNPLAAGANRPVVEMKFIAAMAPAVAWLRQLPLNLPEEIPYRSLGVQVFKAADKLMVQGLGGSDGRSMMTLVLPPLSVPLVGTVSEPITRDVPPPGPDKSIDVGPLAVRLAQPLRPMPLADLSRAVDRMLLTTQPASGPD